MLNKEPVDPQYCFELAGQDGQAEPRASAHGDGFDRILHVAYASATQISVAVAIFEAPGLTVALRSRFQIIVGKPCLGSSLGILLRHVPASFISQDNTAKAPSAYLDSAHHDIQHLNMSTLRRICQEHAPPPHSESCF